MHHTQNGFRKGKSCINNIAQLTTEIKTGMYKIVNTYATLLDVESAYDNVNYETLIYKLIDMECSTRIITMIEKWLYSRKLSFINNSKTTNERTVWKGLSQGAVLSPILYDLYTSNIVDNLENGVKALQFADDIILYVKEPNTTKSKEKIAKAIYKIRDNLAKVGLNLQTEKTEVIKFCYRKNKEKETIKIEDSAKEIKSEARFLGIWLDTELKFAKQTEIVRAKVQKAINFTKFIMGIKWGPECATALILYKALIRALIDYGLFIYFPWESKIRTRLERAQYAGLRVALGYRMSTPTNVMIAEAKDLTLEDRAGFLARNFIAKIYAYGQKELKESIQELSDLENKYRYGLKNTPKSIITEAWTEMENVKNQIRKGPRFEIYESDYWTITNNINTDVETGQYRQMKIIKDDEIWTKIKSEHNLQGENITIYTDGSKNEQEDTVGIRVYREGDQEGISLAIDSKMSILTAELIAINIALKVALEEIKRENKKEVNIIIASDSQSSIKAIENNNISVHMNP